MGTSCGGFSIALAGGGGDHLGQHAAGLDTFQLTMVAENDQAGAAPQGRQQSVPQDEVEHGGFVDDHDVVRQGVAGVEAASVGTRMPA